jgi:predicted nucleic acid-binding protein
MNPDTGDIRTHPFQKSDRLLLDASVWLSVYGPIVRRDWRTDVYSAALGRMVKCRCAIYLDVLVLSEFVNAFARLEYNQLRASVKPKDFKTFRKSPGFGPVARDIAANARKILGVSQRCGSRFEVVDIGAILAEYEQGRSGLNDQFLVEICKTESLTLVTHDSDFRASTIPVLTANRELLSQE